AVARRGARPRAVPGAAAVSREPRRPDPAIRHAGVRPRPADGTGRVDPADVGQAAAARIRDVFADAGCTGWLHARRCTGGAAEPVVGSAVVGWAGADVSVDGHARVVTASVYKLALLVAFCRAAAAGLLDPAARLTVDPA